MRSKIVAVFFLVTAFYIFFNRESYNDNHINWDASGYYLYLPATFIYHDVEKLEFYPGVNRTYVYNPMDYYGIYEQPNGNRLNKYAIGSCLFQLPFFYAARAYCGITHQYPDDGYSKPFSVMHTVCSFVWVFVGLLILAAFLRRYFSDNVTAVTIGAIAFGTNLYTYGIFAPGMSHPFSFVAISAMLLFTDKWVTTKRAGYIIGIAAMLALATIVRPVNIITILIPLFWRVGNVADIKDRFAFLFGKWRPLLIAAVVFMLIAGIQLMYWKVVSGNWVTYSYEGEYFSFSDPHIIDGLFSWRKGWFIYTPLAFFALFGFWFLGRKQAGIALPSIIFLCLYIYVVFSWTQWYYGGGFSARPMIDALPVVAIPLAALLEVLFNKKGGIVVATTLLVALIALNTFQSYQFVMGVLPGEGMTKEKYFRLFGATKLPEVQQ